MIESTDGLLCHTSNGEKRGKGSSARRVAATNVRRRTALRMGRLRRRLRVSDIPPTPRNIIGAIGSEAPARARLYKLAAAERRVPVVTYAARGSCDSCALKGRDSTTRACGDTRLVVVLARWFFQRLPPRLSLRERRFVRPTPTILYPIVP